MEQQKVRAVIFDLDGTLLDTAQDIGAGANLALHRFGLPEHSIEEYHTFIGRGIRRLLRAAMPQDVDEATYEQVVADYLAYYPEHCTERTVFFPGIEQMMRTLEEDGFILGILSNKTETTTLRVIGHFFPQTPFAVVWGNNGVRPLKPQLDAGRLLIQTLQLAPRQIAFVGDGETDMAFASGMGFRAVGVSWGYRSREQLQAAGAERIADTPEQIVQFIRSAQ